MPRELIVGYDGSDRARDALALAAVLAAGEDARVIVTCVHPLAPQTAVVAPQRGHDTRAGAERPAAEGRSRLEHPDEADAESVGGANAAYGLSALADERRAVGIVVGSTH